MNLNAFITDNRTLFIAIAIILILTIIGYFAKKTEFGQKAIEKGQGKIKEVTEVENAESNIEELDTDISKVGLLDAISPNFNDSSLMVGDINQNPNKSNAELGINEDLYVPFGDNLSTNEKIEDLQIEEVVDDDFNIIEKEKNKHEAEVFGENEEDLSVPVEEVTTSINPEELVIEDADIAEQNFEKPDPIIEEISDLVDNTYVINDATDDFENIANEQMEELAARENINNAIENLKLEDVQTESKVQQFKIEEDDSLTNIPSDFEIEQTTSLKLDEINEQIKNLQLEDSDTTIVDDKSKLTKKTRKNKKVSIKSVDEIKQENSVSNNEIDIVQNQEMELPNLDEVVSNNEDVAEPDDMWKF